MHTINAPYEMAPAESSTDSRGDYAAPAHMGCCHSKQLFGPPHSKRNPLIFDPLRED